MCRMATPQRDPRTGVYFIRVAIPGPLKSFFKIHHGKAHEWKKQLVDPDTGDKARSEAQAKRLYPDYYAEWTTAKEAAEAEVHGTEFRLTDRQADSLCGDWLASQLAEHDEDVLDDLQRELNYDMFVDVLEVNRCRDRPSYVHLRRHLERHSYVSDEAAKLLLTRKVPLPVGSEAFLAFCERLARTGIQLVRALDDRAGGDWRVPDAVLNAPTVGLIGSGKGETISQLYESFKQERKLDERQLMEFNKPTNDFIGLVGDIPISRVTPSHVRSFKDAHVEQGLAPATVDSRLSVLRRLFDYAIGNALIAVNPAKEIKVAKSKKDVRPRKPWSPTELQTLLNGSVHGNGKRPKGGVGEASFWLPLLALYTGARLEDIAQLHLEDVCETSDGIVYIDINDNHGKQLKNDSTPRKTPLHKQLLAWGFMGYVEQLKEEKRTKLFPGVETYRGQVAKSWGQWFGNYKRKELGIDPKDIRKDFHSFRHNFKDVARNSGIPKDVRDQLQGHHPGSVGEGYGEGYELKVLKKEIDKLAYAGVDTSVVNSKRDIV